MDNSETQTQEYSIEDVKKQAQYLLYIAQFTKIFLVSYCKT